MEDLRHLENERLLAVFLDNKNKRIAQEFITQGSSNRVCVSPRDVLVPAFRCGAVNLFLLHNHPGGDPFPSKEDIAFTQNIAEVAALAGLPLIDHIVIGDGKYFSFKAERLLK